ncbi:MAG: hypothetical protein RAK18_06785, partial [Conexivisphaerales archaeon]|nr:hypothetical protein [Conexivisphaerales archaeon]
MGDGASTLLKLMEGHGEGAAYSIMAALNSLSDSDRELLCRGDERGKEMLTRMYELLSTFRSLLEAERESKGDAKKLAKAADRITNFRSFGEEVIALANQMAGGAARACFGLLSRYRSSELPLAFSFNCSSIRANYAAAELSAGGALGDTLVYQVLTVRHLEDEAERAVKRANSQLAYYAAFGGGYAAAGNPLMGVSQGLLSSVNAVGLRDYYYALNQLFSRLASVQAYFTPVSLSLDLSVPLLDDVRPGADRTLIEQARKILGAGEGLYDQIIAATASPPQVNAPKLKGQLKAVSGSLKGADEERVANYVTNPSGGYGLSLDLAHAGDPLCFSLINVAEAFRASGRDWRELDSLKEALVGVPFEERVKIGYGALGLEVAEERIGGQAGARAGVGEGGAWEGGTGFDAGTGMGAWPGIGTGAGLRAVYPVVRMRAGVKDLQRMASQMEEMAESVKQADSLAPACLSATRAFRLLIAKWEVTRAAKEVLEKMAEEMEKEDSSSTRRTRASLAELGRVLRERPEHVFDGSYGLSQLREVLSAVEAEVREQVLSRMAVEVIGTTQEEPAPMNYQAVARSRIKVLVKPQEVDSLVEVTSNGKVRRVEVRMLPAALSLLKEVDGMTVEEVARLLAQRYGLEEQREGRELAVSYARKFVSAGLAELVEEGSVSTGTGAGTGAVTG